MILLTGDVSIRQFLNGVDFPNSVDFSKGVT